MYNSVSNWIHDWNCFTHLVAKVVNQLHALGVEHDDVLLDHILFYTAGSMVRGPVGFIEALSLSIGTQGMLVTASWIVDNNRIFDPFTTPEFLGFGIVPNLRDQVVSQYLLSHGHMRIKLQGLP